MDNTTYEFFIRRAWNNIDRFKKGADADIWSGLIMDRADYKDSIGSKNEERSRKKFEKSFAEVKDFLNQAYESLLKKAETSMLGDADLQVLRHLATRASAADSEQQLFEILRRSMEIMNQHKL